MEVSSILVWYLFGALSKNSQIDAWLEKYRKLWEDVTDEIRS